MTYHLNKFLPAYFKRSTHHYSQLAYLTVCFMRICLRGYCRSYFYVRMEWSRLYGVVWSCTFPIMFATVVFGKVINFNLRRRINKLIPVLACTALLFILRLNSRNSFISPKFNPTSANAESIQNCH